MCKRLSLTAGLCFGIGLGLAPALPIAHASKCAAGSELRLQLDAIEGSADASYEHDFWTTNATIWRDDTELSHAMTLTLHRQSPNPDSTLELQP